MVVGGGPTGVELAGRSRTSLATPSRVSTGASIPGSARIRLVEGLERLLPSYPKDLSEAARRQLEELGVEVRTGQKVTAVDEEGITAGCERPLARTVLWGAGVAASSLARALGVPLDRAGRVKVGALTCPSPGTWRWWVAGDSRWRSRRRAGARGGPGRHPGWAPRRRPD